jgi:hypothetical protein
VRLLRLAAAGEARDLHPLLTVVDPDGPLAQALRDAITSLARAEAGRDDGLLEAHGVQFPLRAELLSMLDIDSNIAPVVTADDVPLRPASPASAALAAAEVELLDRAAEESEAASVLEQAEAEVKAAGMALASAAQAAEEAAATATGRIEALDRLAGEVDRLGERRRQVDDELAHLHPGLQQAEARRHQVESDHADVRERRRRATERRESLAEEAVAAEDLAERVTAIEVRLEEVERSLVALRPIATASISAALERLVGTDEPVMVADAEATAMADELSALDAVMEAAVEAIRPLVDSVQARVQLDDARQALLEAEAAVRSPVLDPVLIEQLEQVHIELLDALDKADSRFGGKRADRRVEQHREEEDDLLGRLGFASYSAYMMGSSLEQADPAKAAALVEARAALSAAEATWRQVQDRTDAELVRAEALDRRRTLLERAQELLGASLPAGEVVDALRSHRVPSITEAEARATLAGGLAEVGIVLGGDLPETGDLVLLAQGLLEEAAAADQRHHALVAEQRVLLDERSTLQGLLSSTAEGSAARDATDQERAWALQLEAQEAAANVQLRSISEATHPDPDDLAEEVGHAEAALRELTARRDAARAAWDAATLAHATALAEAARHREAVAHEGTGSTSAEESEWYLLARLASQRSASLAGGFPLLIDRALDGLDGPGVRHVLDRLARMAEIVQVIVLSDDPVVREWAQEAGASRAGLVTAA